MINKKRNPVDSLLNTHIFEKPIFFLIILLVFVNLGFIFINIQLLQRNYNSDTTNLDIKCFSVNPTLININYTILNPEIIDFNANLKNDLVNYIVSSYATPFMNQFFWREVFYDIRYDYPPRGTPFQFLMMSDNPLFIDFIFNQSQILKMISGTYPTEPEEVLVDFRFIDKGYRIGDWLPFHYLPNQRLPALFNGSLQSLNNGTDICYLPVKITGFYQMADPLEFSNFYDTYITYNASEQNIYDFYSPQEYYIIGNLELYQKIAENLTYYQIEDNDNYAFPFIHRLVFFDRSSRFINFNEISSKMNEITAYLSNNFNSYNISFNLLLQLYSSSPDASHFSILSPLSQFNPGKINVIGIDFEYLTNFYGKLYAFFQHAEVLNQDKFDILLLILPSIFILNASVHYIIDKYFNRNSKNLQQMYQMGLDSKRLKRELFSCTTKSTFYQCLVLIGILGIFFIMSRRIASMFLFFAFVSIGISVFIIGLKFVYISVELKSKILMDAVNSNFITKDEFLEVEERKKKRVKIRNFIYLYLLIGYILVLILYEITLNFPYRVRIFRTYNGPRDYLLYIAILGLLFLFTLPFILSEKLQGSFEKVFRFVFKKIIARKNRLFMLYAQKFNDFKNRIEMKYNHIQTLFIFFVFLSSFFISINLACYDSRKYLIQNDADLYVQLEYIIGEPQKHHYEELYDALENDINVKEYFASYTNAYDLYIPEINMYLQIFQIFIDPENYQQFTTFNTEILRIQYAIQKMKDDKNNIIISTNLARIGGYHVGERINYSVSIGGNYYKILSLEIVGIFDALPLLGLDYFPIDRKIVLNSQLLNEFKAYPGWNYILYCNFNSRIDQNNFKTVLFERCSIFIREYSEFNEYRAFQPHFYSIYLFLFIIFSLYIFFLINFDFLHQWKKALDKEFLLYNKYGFERNKFISNALKENMIRFGLQLVELSLFYILIKQILSFIYQFFMSYLYILSPFIGIESLVSQFYTYPMTSEGLKNPIPISFGFSAFDLIFFGIFGIMIFAINFSIIWKWGKKRK